MMVIFQFIIFYIFFTIVIGGILVLTPFIIDWILNTIVMVINVIAWMGDKLEAVDEYLTAELSKRPSEFTPILWIPLIGSLIITSSIFYYVKA